MCRLGRHAPTTCAHEISELPSRQSQTVMRSPTLGLRENAGQFALLVLVNAFVGAVVGVERSVLPLLADEKFGIASATVALTFLVAFGLAKAVMNLAAGELAARLGRKRVLVVGWLFGLPVPLLLMWAPAWEWVVVANLLLGVNQGLAWSAAVIMKIDLVGPRRRGLAMGLNEFAGYFAVALAALGAGYLAAAYGPGTAPFWIAAAAAVMGLALTLLFVRDTAGHVAIEDGLATGDGAAALPPHFLRRFAEASWRDRTMFAANQAGLATNLKDALAWGLLPIFFAVQGLSPSQIGWLAAIYPAAWAIGQIGAGALSDVVGRRTLIVVGMHVQGLALLGFAVTSGFWSWVVASLALGLGTAAVYPTLIAQVADRVTPRDRAAAVGVYRLWRDLGYVAGGLLAGLAADALGFRGAIAVVGGVTIVSGLLAAFHLRADPSTRPQLAPERKPADGDHRDDEARRLPDFTSMDQPHTTRLP
jgi:MFS family permease